MKIQFLLAALVTLAALLACGGPTPTQEFALTETPESTVTLDAHSGFSLWTRCRDHAITSRYPASGSPKRFRTQRRQLPRHRRLSRPPLEGEIDRRVYVLYGLTERR